MQTEDLLKEAAEIFGSCIDLLADSSAGSRINFERICFEKIKK